MRIFWQDFKTAMAAYGYDIAHPIQMLRRAFRP